MLGNQPKPGVVAMESKPEEAHQINVPPVITGSISAGRDIYLTPADLKITESIRRIGVADPANVQQIAASQLELLAGYHQIALAQSRRSFFWALVGSGVGLIFFVAAVAFALATGIALDAGLPI
jgi:hypothetical protein